MSSEQASGFFRVALSDKNLQSKLHHALAVLAPEVVAQIARASGYQADAQDVDDAIGDGDAVRGLRERLNEGPQEISEYVMAHDFWDGFQDSVVWKVVEKIVENEKTLGMFNPFREAAPFRMTIPGPSWVQVMGGERAAEPGGDEEPRPSAVDLYEDNL